MKPVKWFCVYRINPASAEQNWNFHFRHRSGHVIVEGLGGFSKEDAYKAAISHRKDLKIKYPIITFDIGQPKKSFPLWAMKSK